MHRAESMRIRRPVWSAGVGLLALMGVTVLGGCPGRGLGGGDTGTRDPQKYAKMVTAFHMGVVAMAVNDPDRALRSLETATQLYPNEPAAWANLGLAHLRANRMEPAARALEKARSLAPKNADILLLSALWESTGGSPEKAVEYLRRAVELDPNNPIAHARLAEQLERVGAPNSEAEVVRLYEKVLELKPGNLVVLVELSRRAARDGHREKLTRYLQGLAEVSGGWSADPKQRLKSLRDRVGAADPRSLATEVQMLGNVLRQTPEYRASVAALGTSVGNQLGEPIEHFLTLQQPTASPAPRDEGLTFQAEQVTSHAGAWAKSAILRPALPEGEGTASTGAPPAGADEAPTIILDTQGKVALGGEGGRTFAAPGRVSNPEGVLPIDWNDDYRPDLVLAGNGLRLHQQSASGEWTDVTARAGLPASVTGAAYTGAWAADFDVDGDLDVILGAAQGAPLALRNNGDGTWATTRPFPGLSGLRDFVWADLDGDGDPDVAGLDAASRVRVYLNERGGHFTEAGIGEAGGQALALSVADTDRAGALDLIVLRPGGAVEAVRSESPERWTRAELTRWEEAPGSGARLLWGDLDNNGGLDLIASGPGGTRIWLRDEQWRFQPLPSPLDAVVFDVADLNGDGRLDLVGTANGKPVRLLNQGTKQYHWQGLRPRNTKVREGDQKINAFGVGGAVELRAGLLYQQQPITGPRVHFGLGEYPGADIVRIIWPNGQAQGEFELAADHAPLARQRLTGSCPWLFAHDGESLKFVTDVLWKSPLGLRINAQDTAGVSQTRDWVRVRGDQLAPVDGYYDLRVTAELWETDFFDHVSLMVVDHPADTEVVVDERFSIPQPELKLHVTAPPVPVTRALDQNGNDVTELVRAVDGRYLDTFEVGRYQGVATDHYVEVELPAPADGKPHRWLQGTGWVFPTDSSINLAISQGRQPKPEGLSIEVPDGKGGWRVAKKNLGFPAGKYKTVLLDLSGLETDGGAPRRLRLRTNMEIYWDALAVVSPAAGTGTLKSDNLQIRTLLPETADLRYRGFSRLRQPKRSTPETPEYDALTGTEQQWLDLVGFYTRFGDVRELLTKVDDRYVIMNAGDELRLRFAAPPPPPAGWKRDFVFVSDGWDKDGNYNTSYSTTVLPLPSHDRPEYDTPPVPLDQDPVYRKYPQDWVKYHTRYVSVDGFRDALRPRIAENGRMGSAKPRSHASQTSGRASQP